MITNILSQIQAELKAPKNQVNKFGGYNYRSCEDILEAAKPLLAKHNAAITISDDMIEVGGRVYVKATAVLRVGEETIINCAFAREAETKKGMDESQITGSASSYARKYALNGLFAIDDTKDADFTNTHGKEDKTPQTVSAVAAAVNPNTQCSDCGGEIKETKTKDGKTMSVFDIRELSIRKYGRSLCAECMKKVQNGTTNE